MRYFNLGDTLKVGRRGVSKVLSEMRAELPKPLMSLYRRDNRRCGFDIELLARRRIRDKSWSSIGIEVVCDRHEPNNFFLETIEQVESDRPGLIASTSACYLTYLFLGESKIHVFRVDMLREWVKERGTFFQQKYVRTPTGNGHFTTSGIVVPTKYLSDLSMSVCEFYVDVFSSCFKK